MRRSSAGFTLLEMLVVLAIAGLLAGIVLPQLQHLASSIEIAGQRKDLKVAIEGLGYRAYASARPVTLEGSYPGGAQSDAPVALPRGWRIETANAISYAVSGACTGGRLVLVAPDESRETYALAAPKCLLEPVSSP